MHYANGTPAKSGDAVIVKRYNGEVAAGTIHTLNEHAAICNGIIAIPVPGGIIQESVTVGDCYSAADAYAAMTPKSLG